jgi:hypothetical protein
MSEIVSEKQNSEIELAKIKCSLYNSVISNGSAVQKQDALKTAQEAYSWCTNHIGQSEAKVAIPATKASAPAVNSSKK